MLDWYQLLLNQNFWHCYLHWDNDLLFQIKEYMILYDHRNNFLCNKLYRHLSTLYCNSWRLLNLLNSDHLSKDLTNNRNWLFNYFSNFFSLINILWDLNSNNFFHFNRNLGKILHRLNICMIYIFLDYSLNYLLYFHYFLYYSWHRYYLLNNFLDLDNFRNLNYFLYDFLYNIRCSH